MSSSAANQLRVEIREAYRLGDLTQQEYLAELRKLRERTASAAAPREDMDGCAHVENI